MRMHAQSCSPRRRLRHAQLRDMLLNDASENFQLYSEHERAEFIFHLLLRFAIGGSLCQCDDALTEYMLAVKAGYKEMLSVQKNPANNHVEVTSLVYQLSELDGDFKIFKARRSAGPIITPFVFMCDLAPSSARPLVTRHSCSPPFAAACLRNRIVTTTLI